MDNESRTLNHDNGQEEDRGRILRRIEEKLDRLLGRREDDWHEREWAPLDSPFAYYGAGDPSPRFFGGPRADAPGWDPGLAGPRFDRIDVAPSAPTASIRSPPSTQHNRRCSVRTAQRANIIC